MIGHESDQGEKCAGDAVFQRRVLLLGIVVLATMPVSAQNGSPGPRTEDQPSMMKTLADNGEHDIENESWNAYGQFTYISSWKPSFPAAYTNLNGSINSLLPGAEQEFHRHSDSLSGRPPLDGRRGLCGPRIDLRASVLSTSGTGRSHPEFRAAKRGLSRLPVFTIPGSSSSRHSGLAASAIVEESGPMQLGTHYDSRRLVFVAGNFSILDFFDKNAFDIDPRQGFLSLGFMTYAAWDFASDARGYSYGGVAEFYWDDWAVRFGRITPPKDPNQLPVDFRLFKYYGDQIELEHKHTDSWEGRYGSPPGLSKSRGYRPLQRRHRGVGSRPGEERDHLPRIQLRVGQRQCPGSVLGAKAEREEGHRACLPSSPSHATSVCSARAHVFGWARPR